MLAATALSKQRGPASFREVGTQSVGSDMEHTSNSLQNRGRFASDVAWSAGSHSGNPCFFVWGEGHLLVDMGFGELLVILSTPLAKRPLGY